MKQSAAPRPVASCSRATCFGQRVDKLWPVHGVHRRRRTAPRTLPCCSAAGRRSATGRQLLKLSALAAASWSRFSPTSVTPRAARRRTSSAGWNLVTTISVGRSLRPAARAADVNPLPHQPQPVSEFSGAGGRQLSLPAVRRHLQSSHASTPNLRIDRSGNPAGRRKGSRSRGCSPPNTPRGHPARPAGPRTPAGKSRAGVPHEVEDQVAGFFAATSARSCSGTS